MRVRAGLLRGAEGRAFIELGAGKGYLTLMLARATAARNFVVNDVGTFQLKADRYLRPQRGAGALAHRFLRCTSNLKDFVAAGALECPAFAAGKCAAPRPRKRRDRANAIGASTESSLELGDSHSLAPTGRREAEPQCAGSGVSASSAPARSEAEHGAASTAVPHEFVGTGKHLCGAASDFALRSLLAAPTSAAQAGTNTTRPECRGVCLATCCHFRCTWKAYVGKRDMHALGLGQREFELMAMMAGAQCPCLTLARAQLARDQRCAILALAALCGRAVCSAVRPSTCKACCGVQAGRSAGTSHPAQARRAPKLQRLAVARLQLARRCLLRTFCLETSGSAWGCCASAS